MIRPLCVCRVAYLFKTRAPALNFITRLRAKYPNWTYVPVQCDHCHHFYIRAVE